MQTFIYQFVVLTKINRLTLKRFEEKYLLLSGFTLEVVHKSRMVIRSFVGCADKSS